jgi:hypothetical protein
MAISTNPITTTVICGSAKVPSPIRSAPITMITAPRAKDATAVHATVPRRDPARLRVKLARGRAGEPRRDEPEDPKNEGEVPVSEPPRGDDEHTEDEAHPKGPEVTPRASCGRLSRIPDGEEDEADDKDRPEQRQFADELGRGPQGVTSAFPLRRRSAPSSPRYACPSRDDRPRRLARGSPLG